MTNDDNKPAYIRWIESYKDEVDKYQIESELTKAAMVGGILGGFILTTLYAIYMSERKE
jgi:hypothetical protein